MSRMLARAALHNANRLPPPPPPPAAPLRYSPPGLCATHPREYWP